MAARRGSARSGRTAHLGLIAVVSVAAVATLGLFAALVFRTPQREGFRLRAQTMIPLEVNEAGAIDCPESPNSTPYDYSSDGALADELPVYEGELVAVRVTLSPLNGPVPDRVDFTSRWPTAVVTDAGPICAFVTVDDVGSATNFEWESTGDAEASFSVENPRRFGNTVVEIWLEAIAPVPGATLFTEVRTTEIRDEFVVDPLNGRISIDRRPGVLPDLDLVSDPDASPDDPINFTAVVRNRDDRDRSFDVEVTVDSATPGVSVTVEAIPDGVACSSTTVVVCAVGDITGDEPVKIPFTVDIASDATPQPVECGTQTTSLGVCVTAVVTAEATGSRADRSAELFFARGVSTGGDLVIATEAPTVVRRPGEEAIASFAVSGPGAGDVASVSVVGSDCFEILRVTGPVDDGDAFLEPEEIWAFECTVAPDSPDDFRLELDGVGPDGSRITGSYATAIQTVDPAVEVRIAAAPEGDRTDIVVTNIGLGALDDVTILLPGCADRADPPSDALAEQQSVTFSCLTGDIAVDDVVIYATDIAGRAFVSGVDAGI